eukprot:Opistho-1_new@73040
MPSSPATRYRIPRGIAASSACFILDCASLATVVSHNYIISRNYIDFQTLRERLRPLVTDTVSYMHRAISEHKRVLVEGANATMLDIDFGEFVFGAYWASHSPVTC